MPNAYICGRLRQMKITHKASDVAEYLISSYIRIKNQLTYRNRAKYMLDKMHYERHTYKS